ncbi:MAG: biotin/lipoyl-binding protein [Lachnospiraceae bacterium]|jgi:multidrug resistance efflux pump|nr:biotin/lipoyl-binding protein [Lachnospiraceae bacterium]
MNENTNPSKRREWVKNAAIIFLSIMLVLTFFSNTIMNYSLPEVATEYVQRGTITEKVRGTGNITATDPYNVSIEESRIISSVAVKSGDEVKKGDVLFYLEDEESTELLDAEKELNSLILAYQLAVITESMEVGTVSNIENDNTLSLTQKQRTLQNAMAAVDAAQAEYDSATLQVASANKELGYIGNQVVDTTNERNAVSNAQKESNKASQEVANAQANATKATENVTIAENNVLVKESELEAAKAEVESMQSLKNEVNNYETTLQSKRESVDTAQNNFNNAESNLNTAEGDLQRLKDALQQWKDENPSPSDPEEEGKKIEAIRTQDEWVGQKRAEYEEAKSILEAAKQDYESFENSYPSLQDQYISMGGDEKLNQLLANAAAKENELAQANQDVVSAKNQVSEANKEVADKQSEQSSKASAVTDAQQALTEKENSNDNSVAKANASNQLLDAQDRQAKAQTALDKAKEELTNIQKELLAEINLESQNDAIELQMEKIEKLKEKSVGATVEAPVDGMVMSLDKVAGDKTEPAETIAVIQVAGKGFTLAFSATTEQARKLSVGDIAELQNAWYYDNVKATLASIKPDPDNPAQKKLLTFNVEGDVQAGQSLSLSVGQRSSEYELVVPNSAVREDNNGKFILIVESKSSPLGNRYIATRVDVEVLASDDTHTAISAGLYGHEYVITTATKPVEAGKQVRLTD